MCKQKEREKSSLIPPLSPDTPSLIHSILHRIEQIDVVPDFYANKNTVNKLPHQQTLPCNLNYSEHFSTGNWFKKPLEVNCKTERGSTTAAKSTDSREENTAGEVR